MDTKRLTPIVTTNELDAAKRFYTEHFGFEIFFDNGDHLSLRSPDGAVELSFMRPDSDAQPVFAGGGLMYCLLVDDVDAEHDRLVGRGLDIVRPLQDNPWGDRSFSLVDPVGVVVYLYTEIPVTPELEGFFNR